MAVQGGSAVQQVKALASKPEDPQFYPELDTKVEGENQYPQAAL